MNLNQLPKLKDRSKKRPGRGLGSGKGKTGGRGMKGAKSRGSMPLGFIGGTLPLYKRLPFRRGLGNSKVSAKLLPLNIKKLEVFKKDDVIDLQSLQDKGLISSKDVKKKGVKITGSTKLEQPLTVKLPVSQSAKKAIEKAGGVVANA